MQPGITVWGTFFWKIFSTVKFFIGEITLKILGDLLPISMVINKSCKLYASMIIPIIVKLKETLFSDQSLLATLDLFPFIPRSDCRLVFAHFFNIY